MLVVVVVCVGGKGDTDILHPRVHFAPFEPHFFRRPASPGPDDFSLLARGDKKGRKFTPLKFSCRARAQLLSVMYQVGACGATHTMLGAMRLRSPVRCVCLWVLYVFVRRLAAVFACGYCLFCATVYFG